MRYTLILLTMLLGPVLPAKAEVSIGIGINIPVYPEFVRVPSYPVYYAPRVGYNLFFYDGLYWAYYNDNWYASSWYDGPWGMVSPMYVPVYVLRVPVRYYRRPPAYFYGWPRDAAPRWDQYYGRQWHEERRDWDTWNHRYSPAPAPLPVYQRQYSGNKYPRVEQQPVIRGEHYHYQPSSPVARQHYEQESAHADNKGGKQGHGKGHDDNKGGHNDQGRND
jgi:hypothetical protein